jgi:serine protease Do
MHHTFPLLAVFFAAGLAAAQTSPPGPRGSSLQVVEPDPAERDLRMTPVVRAVQKAADSVVSIYLQHLLARREPVTEGQGSGVILDDSGLVITNWHVVAPVVLGGARGELEVQIKLRDGRARAARVLSSSATRDLALLQMQLQGGEKVKPIEVGRSADLMIGETVVAIGNPQGHANTVTSGVLSAIDRSIRVRAPDGEPREYAGLLQTDAAINQGNSGGALLDITGRLIGINNAMAVGAENIGFAIPVDAVRAEFQRELLRSTSFGAADGPWLGLEVTERDGAVVVESVVAGSPAAVADVRTGDELLAIGSQPVKAPVDYLRHLVDTRPRQELRLQLRRDGRTMNVAPVLISREEGLVLAAIGCTVHQVDYAADPAAVRQATIAFYEGSTYRRVPPLPAIVRVGSVQPDGPAAAIDLRPGDVILTVVVPQPRRAREMPVTALRDLAQIIDHSRGESLRIGILRGDETLDGVIDVRKAAK